MKKYALVLLLLALGITTWAATFEVDNLKYEVITSPSGSTRGTVKCTGLSTAGASASSLQLIIPYLVSNGSDNYYVTTIGPLAFKNQGNITSVFFRHGIEVIGTQAFYGCSSLNYVHLSSAITNIYAGAFASCSSLKRVYSASFTPSTMNINSSAFDTSTSRQLYVANGADFDDYRACSMFSNSYFPHIKHSKYAFDFQYSTGEYLVVTKAATADTRGEATITGFNGNASDVSQGIFSINYVASSSSVSDKAFNYVAVADSAFYGETSLTQLRADAVSTITSWGKSMAEGCTSLTRVVLPSGEIGERAFQGCTMLSSAELDGVTRLGAQSLANCTSLFSFNIPASVTSVNTSFAMGCSNLSEFTVDEDNAHFSAYRNVLYNKDQTILYRMPEGYKGYFAYIAPTVTTVYPSAFLNCAIVSYIRLPYGTKTVGDYAFMGCQNVKFLLIPSSTKSMGRNLFNNCPSLEELYINTTYAPTINKSTMFQSAAIPELHVQRHMVDAFKAAGWTDMAGYNTDDVVAYDDYSSILSLHYTVTSTEPVTINGTTYDGRVKVVRGYYSADMKGKVPVYDYTTIADKKYAITRIDSLAFGTSNSFYVIGCENVDTVGYRAFYGQPVTSIALPAARYIEKEAMSNATSLAEVVTRAAFTSDGQFYGNNASDFNLYVPNELVRSTMQAQQGYDFDGNTTCGEHVAPCFTATHSTFPLGMQANLDFASSNLPAKPRYVSDYDASTGIATTSAGLDKGRSGRGVILTGLTPGEFYKIPRYFSTFTSAERNYMQAVGIQVNLLNYENAYYWDADNLKFVKPTSNYYLPAGQAFMRIAGAGSEIYLDLFPGAGVKGDLNGDGIVDITDVNMAINMVLGKTAKTSAADVDGSGDVDITDVNLVINIALGK